MPLVSNSAKEKFASAIDSAPNDLTKVLRCHRAVEIEIHNALGVHLSLSSRLDLRKVPFLTKVDLLASLGALDPVLFPFFAEANRIRNRFAHNPDADLLDEDLARFKDICSSSRGSPVPAELEIDTPGRAIEVLFQMVYTAARSSYEYGANARIQSRAVQKWLSEQGAGRGNRHKSEAFMRIRREADRRIADAARELLKTEHPDVDFLYLHGIQEEQATNEKKDQTS
jgi:hypothetical protein